MAKDQKVNIAYTSKYKKASANGATTVFVYEVTGSEQAIEAYKASCEKANFPAKVDDDSGNLLYFTTRFHNNKNQLTISGFSGKTFVEDNATDIMNSVLDQQSNPEVKKALAGEIARTLLANALGGSAPVASAPVADVVAETVEETADEENADM